MLLKCFSAFISMLLSVSTGISIKFKTATAKQYSMFRDIPTLTQLGFTREQKNAVKSML